MKLVVGPMQLEDINQVLEVDRESYTTPWPATAYRRELLQNGSARYVVLREVNETEEPEAHDAEPRPKQVFPFLRWPLRAAETAGRPGRVIGYAGMWHMVDEVHITTIAMREAWRGQGLGELLLVTLVESAIGMGVHRVTLEVRVSNQRAQNLYEKYGFRQVGRRTRYYSDNNEDAFIMTTGNVQDAEYMDNFHNLVNTLRGRLSGSGREIEAPSFRIPATAD